MRIEILNDEGEVESTILADEAFCEEHHPGRWRPAPVEESQAEEPPGEAA